MRKKITLFNLLSLIFVFSRSIAPLPAQEAAKAPAAKRPPDVTPLTLDGAETHVFHATPQGEMRLHVFKPAGWRAGDRRPVFVWFFGGGWTTGTPANAAYWAKIAAGWGMVAIAPDYRTKGRHDTPPHASVADARAAVQWVQKHAAELGIDPAKVVVGGNSAGGHVALWTGIAKAPPGSDAKESPLVKPAALVLTAPVSDTSKATGYTPQRFGDDAEALSPVHQLDAQMPPLLLFHGDADKTVPQRQSIALDEKYRATGNTCEFVSVPGGSHNYGGEMPEWREKTREMTRAFLAKLRLL
ncbi:MAG: alpha/beta hydrolase [Verrucomicrobia bacterium]|nr:alpha/beta hydrolase [Verrucomicrobiota bacterium]